MKNVDEILKNHLQTAIHVDLSVFNGLNVLDEYVDVGLDGLDLFIREVQEWTKGIEESIECCLQISQETVEWSGRLVG